MFVVEAPGGVGACASCWRSIFHTLHGDTQTQTSRVLVGLVTSSHNTAVPFCSLTPHCLFHYCYMHTRTQRRTLFPRSLLSWPRSSLVSCCCGRPRTWQPIRARPSLLSWGTLITARPACWTRCARATSRQEVGLRVVLCVCVLWRCGRGFKLGV